MDFKLREYIVITAIDLIHENGINHLSTKEIAKRRGISEAMVFKVFPRKNDLILGVMDHFSLYDGDLFRTAYDKYENAVEAIIFYVDKLLVYYENYPAMTSIFRVLDMHFGVPEIEEKTYKINSERYEQLRQLIIKAQNDGKLIQSADATITADILYSTLKGICIKWSIDHGGFPLRERINGAVRMILESLKIT